jgi:hypothetical protein
MTRQVPRRRAGAMLPASLVTIAAIVVAQRIMVAPGRVVRAAPKRATTEDFDGSFIYALGVNLGLDATAH